MTKPNNYKLLVTGDEIWFPNTYIACSYILVGELGDGAAVVLDVNTGSLVAVMTRLMESTGQHYNVSDRLFEACDKAIMNGSYQIPEKLLTEENLSLAA